MSSSFLRLLAAVAAAGMAPLGAQQSRTVDWTGSVQTGLADTFQMTLGGTFGEGPAWQNRVATGLSNAFRRGDALSIYGSDTYDLRDHSHNWQAGLGYKLTVFRRGKQTVSLGSGLQHWRLPSVKTGTNDWLIPGNLTYQIRSGRYSFIATGDSWTLLKSPLPLGSLLHTQGWIQVSVGRPRGLPALPSNRGPHHTYSWDFWNTHGNRVAPLSDHACHHGTQHVD